jgi:hypothetical protein
MDGVFVAVLFCRDWQAAESRQQQQQQMASIIGSSFNEKQRCTSAKYSSVFYN